MEAKRLIPYSVHLPEDVYNKLKEAAGNRKASALVRDAITLIVEGDDEFSTNRLFEMLVGLGAVTVAPAA